MQLDWLDEGAIQLLLPGRLLAEWHGSASPDYERACASSSNWLNPLPVGGSLGFVLGGDPAMVLVVPGTFGSSTVVRWLFADNEHDLVAFALRRDGVSRVEPELTFDNADETWCVFDAAANPLADRCARRSLALPVGRVRVETALHKSENNGAIVHRFSQVTAGR